MTRSPGNAHQRTDQWLLAQGRLAPGETIVLPMLTGSMAPLIPAGAEIEVRAVEDTAGLQVGDIVVFRQEERLVAHRLIFACSLPAPGWFLQRGDSVSKSGFISGRRIVGLVTAVRRVPDERVDLTAPRARALALRMARRSLYRLLTSWFDRARDRH